MRNCIKCIHVNLIYLSHKYPERAQLVKYEKKHTIPVINHFTVFTILLNKNLGKCCVHEYTETFFVSLFCSVHAVASRLKSRTGGDLFQL